MAEREIDRILSQYGGGAEPAPLANHLADPHNELGTSATTSDIASTMDRMYAGFPGLLRSAADRVRGASQPDNIIAGGLDTAANWASGTPRVGPDTLAPLGLGAMAMPFAVPGAVGIFGGRLARTADQDALRLAEEMAAAGRPRQDIWDQTGWFQGRDGQWRFEIDDSLARLTPEAHAVYDARNPNRYIYGSDVPGVIVHDDLMAAYPDLANVGAGAFYTHGKNESGSYFPNTDSLSISSSSARGARDTLLHELQHAVQQREGFTPGGSPRDAPGVYNDLADEINRLIAQSGGNLDRATPEVAARVGELRRQIRSIPSDPQQLYRHLAGEVEARNVTARRDFDEADRRRIPPWQTQDVPDVDQILRQYYGPGERAMMSAPELTPEIARQVADYRDEGIFLRPDHTAAPSVMPRTAFTDGSIRASQTTVDPRGVRHWERQIRDGARPAILLEETAPGQHRIVDGHTRATAYHRAGIEDVPVLIRSRAAPETTASDILGQYYGPGAQMSIRDALPMDEASRLARAVEQGYTIEAYKGGWPYHPESGPVRNVRGDVVRETPLEPLTELNAGAGSSALAARMYGLDRIPWAGFFSDSRDVANRFASLGSGYDGGAVFPVRLRMRNPLEIDAGGQHAAAFQFERVARERGTLDQRQAFMDAFRDGSPYDGVILRNTADEGTVYVPRAPSQIRSRHAAFDPANADSGQLLAANPLAASIPGVIVQPSERDKP